MTQLQNCTKHRNSNLRAYNEMFNHSDINLQEYRARVKYELEKAIEDIQYELKSYN